jgi:hypothetical protein
MCLLDCVPKICSLLCRLKITTHDGDTEHAFILGLLDCTDANKPRATVLLTLMIFRLTFFLVLSIFLSFGVKRQVAKGK